MQRIITLLFVLLALCFPTPAVMGETLSDTDIIALETYGMTCEEISQGVSFTALVSCCDPQEEARLWSEVFKLELNLDVDADKLHAISVPSTNEALMLMSSGRLDFVELPSAAARYIAALNNEVGVLEDPRYALELRMLFNADDAALRDQVNAALAEMRQDGTLDALKAEYIDSAEYDATPAQQPSLKTDAAQSIRVGVFGTIPPYDYSTAAGEPTGYNAALLAELGKRMGVNIVLVPIANDAVQIAFAADRIDAVLWYAFEGRYENGEYVSDYLDETGILSSAYICSDCYAYDGWSILVPRERAQRGMAAREKYGMMIPDINN